MIDLDSILQEWVKDCSINELELATESVNTPTLHSKYLRYHSNSRIRLKRLVIQKKKLHKTLSEYFRGDLNNPDDLAEIKREPWPKTVLKTEIPSYIEADSEMMELCKKIAYIEELVDITAEIIKHINNRGFQIKNAIDWHKFQNGGY